MLRIWLLSYSFVFFIVFGSWALAAYFVSKRKQSWQVAWISSFLLIPWIIHLVGLINTNLTCFLAVTVFFIGALKGRKPLLQTLSLVHFSKLAWILPIFYLALKTIDASTLLPHGDPLTYHLRGPLIWIEDNHIHFPHAIPVASICNLVEMYYMLALKWAYWAQSYTGPLLSLSTLEVKIIGHISSQLLSVWMGFVSCMVIGIWLWKRYRPRQFAAFDSVSILLIWLACVAPQTEWLVPLAKNNWLANAYVLVGLIAFALKDPKDLLFIGASVAGAYWAKATNLLLIFPTLVALGCFYLFRFEKSSKPFRNIVHLSLGALVVSIPFLIRNYMWTKNPFYPSEFGPLTSNLISESDKLDFAGFFAPFQIPPKPYFWSAFWEMLFPVLKNKKPISVSATLLYGGGILFVATLALKWISNKNQRNKGILVLLSAFVSVFWLGSIMGPRFFDAHVLGYLVFLRFLGVGALCWALILFRWEKKAASVFFILGAISVNFPVHILWKDFWPVVSGKISTKQMVYLLPMGQIYQCINEKLPDNSKVVSDWLNTTYYVKGRIPTIGNHAPLERLMRTKPDFEARKKLLKENGFTHLWLNFPCPRDQDWPKCSAVGVYSLERTPKNQVVCSQGGTYVIKL